MDKEAGEWRSYRTRFLIRARPIKRSMVFVDAMGCKQRGKRGDYLVEFAIGLRRILPRNVFEDLYVALEPGAVSEAVTRTPASPAAPANARRSKKKTTSSVSVQNRRSSPASQPLIA